MINKINFYKMCKVCSWKTCAGCSAFCSLTFLFAAIFAFSALQNVINQQAISQVQMSSQTYKLWGELPGLLNANVSRYYSFFNFTNPYETVYLNQTPKFVLMPANLYQEYEYFLKPNFSDIDSDGNLNVCEYFYYDYVLPNNVVENQTVTTVNIGAMGFWYNVKTAPGYQIAVSVLALLIQSIQDQILLQVYSTGIYYEFLNAQYSKYTDQYSKFLTDPDTLYSVWYDPNYGMGNPGSFCIWIQATIDGVDSGASVFLMDYFGISYGTMDSILSNKTKAAGFLANGINAIRGTLPGLYDCPTPICTKEYMAALQWSSQAVTMSVQAPIPPQPSILTSNDTATGFPEISYFLNSYLVPLQNLDKQEYNITFSVDLALQLLNFTPSKGSKYCKEQDTLLNIGNLQYLFKIGEIFDANQPQNLSLLTPIQERFKLPSLQHAYVIWEYLKYMYAEFGEQQSAGGDSSVLLLGNSFSQTLYQYFSSMQDYLLPEITSQIIYSNLSNYGYTCESLMDETFNDTQLTQIACSLQVLNPLTLESAKYLYYTCLSQATQAYKQLDILLNISVSPFKYLNLCQDPENGYSAIFLAAQNLVKTHYNCTVNSNACSAFEIAVKQWGGATITSNPPPGISLPASYSVSSWNSTLFPTAFEYYSILTNKLPGALPGYDTIEPISTEIGYKLLNFNDLFNGVVAGNAFIFSQNSSYAQQYQQFFYNLDAFLLKTYIRYMVLEVFMGGFSQTRKTVDLLWGYTDPLLVQISQLSPLAGGDPAVNPVIALSGGNMTKEQALQTRYSMYTGFSDISKIRMYKTVYDKKYIANNISKFNGNETVNLIQNPWREEVELYGTDSLINMPGLNENYNPPIFINSIYYQTNVTYQNKTVDYSGLKALRFGLSEKAMQNSSNNPANSVYYLDKWNGLLNFSSVQQAPVFFSKNNFLSCDQEIIDSVESYYDANMTQKIVPNSADDTFVDLEPTTGANLGSMVRLQLSYEFKNDSLFNTPNYAMLPLFNLQRGSNFSESMISETYGQLIMGLTIVRVGPTISYVLFGVLITLFGLSLYKIKKNSFAERVRQQENENSIMMNNPEITEQLMTSEAEEPRVFEPHPLIAEQQQ